MSELRATVGNSYKCSAEENLQVTDKALVNVFNVQVQVFKIDGDKFGAGKRFTFWECNICGVHFNINILFCSQMSACGCYP